MRVGSRAAAARKPERCRDAADLGGLVVCLVRLMTAPCLVIRCNVHTGELICGLWCRWPVARVSFCIHRLGSKLSLTPRICEFRQGINLD